MGYRSWIAYPGPNVREVDTWAHPTMHEAKQAEARAVSQRKYKRAWVALRFQRVIRAGLSPDLRTAWRAFNASTWRPGALDRAIYELEKAVSS